MRSYAEIVIAICVLLAIALAAPLIGAVMAILEAAIFQENSDAE